MVGLLVWVVIVVVDFVPLGTNLSGLLIRCDLALATLLMYSSFELLKKKKLIHGRE